MRTSCHPDRGRFLADEGSAVGEQRRVTEKHLLRAGAHILSPAMFFPAIVRRLGILCAISLLAAAILAGWTTVIPARAQELDIELESTGRLMPDVGPGVRAIHRDSKGRYYVLTAPGPSILVYDRDGQLYRHIPKEPSKTTGIVYGLDFDMDSEGDIYVADRGTDTIKMYDSDGRLARSIDVPAPNSIAALPGGEIAVSTTTSRHLITIYDANGNRLRDFGDFVHVTQRPDVNRNVNAGRILTDPSNFIYYAFSYLPEPTVRKYDRTGHAETELSLQTIEFEPEAQARRRYIADQEDNSKPVPLREVINAIGVDPKSGDIWIAIDDELVHYDRDGNRKGVTYRTFTPEGERLVPISILVDPDRLIYACDPAGVYTLPRPDMRPGVAPEKPEEKPAPAPPQKP